MTDGKELKDQRIPIMMTETEVIAIDDWPFPIAFGRVEKPSADCVRWA